MFCVGRRGEGGGGRLLVLFTNIAVKPSNIPIHLAQRQTFQAGISWWGTSTDYAEMTVSSDGGSLYGALIVSRVPGGVGGGGACMGLSLYQGFQGGRGAGEPV